MKDRIGTETYFTPKQAAGYFNLSLSTIKNYIYAGRLKTLITPGGHHRISRPILRRNRQPAILTSVFQQ